MRTVIDAPSTGPEFQSPSIDRVRIDLDHILGEPWVKVYVRVITVQ